MKRRAFGFRKMLVLLFAEYKRDTQSAAGFLMVYPFMFFTLVSYGFYLKTVSAEHNIQIDGYTVAFPFFLVSGLVVVRIIPFSIRICEDTLLYLRGAGIMEWTLTTASNIWELFAARALWNVIRLSVEIAALIVIARICIGTPVRLFFQGALIPPLFFLFVAYAGIGMILSGFSVLFRRGEFMFKIFYNVSALIGGVFIPTQLFTGNLKIIGHASKFFPITHALHTVRLILLGDETPALAAHQLLLGVMALILFLAGFAALHTGLTYAKKAERFSKHLYN